MGTQHEYSAVANVLMKIITAEEDADIPEGWERSFVPADLASRLAGACAKAAVDTLDKFRAENPQLPLEKNP